MPTKAKPASKAAKTETVSNSQPQAIGTITTVHQDEGTLNVHIVFDDGSKIEKLCVSNDVYKQFEECFQAEDWKKSTLAFVNGELSEYEGIYSL